MGVRADGVHVFGVKRGFDEATQMELMDVVEATGYAIASGSDLEGPLLSLSDGEGNIVAQYSFGEWLDVVDQIPGVDAEESQQ